MTQIAADWVASSASADEAADIRAGRDMAARLCAQRHDPSPQAEETPVGATARPLRLIARSENLGPEALKVFLRSTSNSVSHPGVMPGPGLTEEQIRQMSAFLTSLRGAP